MDALRVVLWLVSGVTMIGIGIVASIIIYEAIPDRVKYTCEMAWSIFLIIILIAFVLTGIGWAGYNLIKYIF